MKLRWIVAAAATVWLLLAPVSAYCATLAPGNAPAFGAQTLAKVIPGKTSKADIRALFGAPWRVIQFNDCGEAMDDQADETWEYRGSDASGTFRLHLEFGDKGVVHLIAKIPDNTVDGKGTVARVAPGAASTGMSM